MFIQADWKKTLKLWTESKFIQMLQDYFYDVIRSHGIEPLQQIHSVFLRSLKLYVSVNSQSFIHIWNDANFFVH